MTTCISGLLLYHVSLSLFIGVSVGYVFAVARCIIIVKMWWHLKCIVGFIDYFGFIKGI